MSTKKPTPKVQLPDRDDGGSVVLERITQRTKPPQMFQVLMVLQEFFSKDREQATQIMLQIHLDGKGVCGVYSKDIAATKVDQVMDAARKSGHPLQCVAEPIE
jgi:ATP-dependent Clp protease adaptor protein ClpS